MKKLIAIFSLVLLITVAKAQQTTGTTNPTPASPAATIPENDKQCHGVSKDCPMPCTSASEKKSKNKSKASTDSKASSGSSTATMSAEHVGTGSTVISTSSNDKKCSGKKGKSCCQGASKASAINTVPPVQPASETPAGDSPK